MLQPAARVMRVLKFLTFKMKGSGGDQTSIPRLGGAANAAEATCATIGRERIKAKRTFQSDEEPPSRTTNVLDLICQLKSVCVCVPESFKRAFVCVNPNFKLEILTAASCF